MRHISCCFEKKPGLRPPATPLGQAIDTTNYKKTALSSTQATQIREIFELFDTDGGGCIDQKELQFAMTALGFQTQENKRQDKHQEAMEVMNNLVDDGKVTLEEFTALMTGELDGQDLYEDARTAFALLSRPDSHSEHDGLITLSKLNAVCQELEVIPGCWAVQTFSGISSILVTSRQTRLGFVLSMLTSEIPNTSFILLQESISIIFFADQCLFRLLLSKTLHIFALTSGIQIHWLLSCITFTLSWLSYSHQAIQSAAYAFVVCGVHPTPLLVIHFTSSLHFPLRIICR